MKLANIKYILTFTTLLLLMSGCDQQKTDKGSSTATPNSTEAVDADELDLSGETITILVGFNPGGGTDTGARLLNQYLSKHLPGEPNVIVQNMNGAAGIRALNYTFERAKPDGRTILFAPISLLVPLLGEAGVRYELAKFDVVGGLRSGPLVQLARNDVVSGGIQSAAQIMQAEDLRLGGIRTSSSLDLMARLAFDSLALEHKYVTGYSSENTIRNAIQTAEINSFNSTFAGYKSAVISTLVEPGVVAPLWQFPYQDEQGNYPRSNFAADIPTFMEVYESIRGQAPSGEHWDALKLALNLRSVADNMLLAPPNTDPEVLQVLREAFAKSVVDPDMIAETTKVLGYFYEVVPNDSIRARFAEMANVKAEPVAFIKQYMAEVN